MWGYKDKAISVRVDSDKYNKIMEYIRKNKYNTYPQLSVSRIVDDAFDEFIKQIETPTKKTKRK